MTRPHSVNIFIRLCFAFQSVLPLYFLFLKLVAEQQWWKLSTLDGLLFFVVTVDLASFPITSHGLGSLSSWPGFTRPTSCFDTEISQGMSNCWDERWTTAMNLDVKCKKSHTLNIVIYMYKERLNYKSTKTSHKLDLSEAHLRYWKV